MDSGTYQPIIPNCMPSSYPLGKLSLITLRTAVIASRRSGGSAARYWATVEADIMGEVEREIERRKAKVERRQWSAVVAEGTRNYLAPLFGITPIFLRRR